MKADFSGLGWLDAFDALILALEVHYPYTIHRNISWTDLSLKYRDVIAKAASQSSREAYIGAMRDLLSDLKDGHCSVESTSPLMKEAEERIKKDEIGGYYGAVFGRDEKGHVVVIYVSDPSTGLEVGHDLMSVDGVPVQEALSRMSLRWSDPVPTTVAHRDQERLRFLSRGS